MADARFQDWTTLSAGERRLEAEACLRRLAEFGPGLNAAIAILAPPTDLSGPLAGLPYATKDMLDRIGRVSGWGGVRPGSAQSDATACVLQRLDAAGAVEVAVASMTELAYEPSGYNGQRGRVLNPWHPEAVTGGSSSGSAALVACGAVVLGIGSDTGGSVRIPASCCGITGLKPTNDTTFDSAVMPLAPSMDTIGFMARSAGELAMVLPAILSVAADAPPEPFTRAAVLTDCLDEAVPAVQRACAAGIEALRETGVAMSDTRLGKLLDDIDAVALTVMQAESALSHANRDFEAGRLSSTLMRRLTKGLEIGDEVLEAALAARTRLRQAFVDVLGGAELALLPVMPVATPMASETDPTGPDFQPRVLYAMSRFTRFVNALGLPALSVPCGFDQRGIPVGLQLVGPAGSEARLLATAASMQAITDWHGRVPTAVPHRTRS